MSTAQALPLDVLKAQTPTVARDATPARIRQSAEEFEAMFLSALLQPAFAALDTDGTFGGGQGEAAFKSFLVDAMAKQSAKAGGIGLSDTVSRELLKLQGLSS